MESRLECDVVQDLLPSYVEHMTSQVTTGQVEAHLKECRKCRQIFNEITQEVNIDSAEEACEVQKFLKKTKIMYAMMALAITCAIAIVVCLIVNIAVNRTLSWSLIPTAAILFGYAGIYTLAKSKKNRLVKALFCCSVLVVPLLAVIQITLYYRMAIGTIWFWKYALPITILWLGIVWFTVFCHRILKLNIFFSLSVLSFLSAVGSGLTNYFAGDYSNLGEMMVDFFFTGLGGTIAGIVFLILGICFTFIKRNKEYLIQ